jgi:prepilin peptidase CpaA
MSLWWIIQAISIPLCAIAAITDHRSGRIPNWLTLPGLVAFPIAHTVLGGLSALGFSLFGAAVCALIPYLFFRKRACGGGDVKLFALLGAVGGPTFGLEAQLFAFFLATMFVLGRMVWAGQAWSFLSNSVLVAFNPILPKSRRREVPANLMTPVRLGIPIFVGVGMALLVRAPFWSF